MTKQTGGANCQHIVPTGRFTVEAVGESFHLDALNTVVGGADTEYVVTLCTATLGLEEANPHDPDAVAVFIEGLLVGHLSRIHAVRFRRLFAAAGGQHRQATCAAAISSRQGRDHMNPSHCIDLDLPFDQQFALQDSAPDRAGPIRLSTDPTILSDGKNEILVRVPFLRLGPLGIAQDGTEVTTWRSPDRSRMHFYPAGSSGGSSCLTVIYEDVYPGIADQIERLNLYAYRTEGHTLSLRASASADFRLPKEDAIVRVFVVEARATNGALTEVVALPFTARASNGQLTVQDVPLTWGGSSASDDVEALGVLANALDTADVIVTMNASSTIWALSHRLNIEYRARPLWRCASSRWGENMPEAPPGALCGFNEPADAAGLLLEECITLSRMLFTHTGKTTRSRTNLHILLG